MHREFRKTALALVISAAVTLVPLALFAETAYADISGDNGKTIPAASVSIPVKHEITGGRYTGDDRFEFILTARDDGTPMPAGSEGRIKRVTVTGRETPDFGSIVLEYPDVYYYTVSRKAGSYDKLKTDNRTFTVMIAKFNDGSTDVVIWNDSGEKVGTVTYTDDYEMPAKSPRTGDLEIRRNAIMWIAAGLSALAGFIVILSAYIAGKKSASKVRRKEATL